MPLDALIVNQSRIGLWVLVVGGLYLLAILVPLTARASWRSRMLLGTGSIAKFLSLLLFSVGGMAFNLLVLVCVLAGAGFWALHPVPTLYGVEPVRVVREAPDNKWLILHVGGWRGGEGADAWLRLLVADHRFDGADIKSVDYVDLLARREPRLIELAQALQPAVHGVIADPKYTSVVLVGHSVGGLLARWWAAPDGKPAKVLPIKALLDLAVPKRGADVAALATALGLPERLLAEAADEAGIAGAAQRRWRDLGAASGAVYCVLGGRDKAVPRESAFHACARRDDEAEADHRTIAAPADAEALGYRRPASLLAAALAR